MMSAGAVLVFNNVAALAVYGLSFDICVLARQLPLAIDLVRKCSDTKSILDRCRVLRVKEKELDLWRAHISEIASAPTFRALAVL
jgi:predicted TIM-barrel fold metal-dependent hydrolase